MWINTFFKISNTVSWMACCICVYAVTYSALYVNWLICTEHKLWKKRNNWERKRKIHIIGVQVVSKVFRKECLTRTSSHSTCRMTLNYLSTIEKTKMEMQRNRKSWPYFLLEIFLKVQIRCWMWNLHLQVTLQSSWNWDFMWWLKNCFLTIALYNIVKSISKNNQIP